jgi:hypothetical protein
LARRPLGAKPLELQGFLDQPEGNAMATFTVTFEIEDSETPPDDVGRALELALADIDSLTVEDQVLAVEWTITERL